MMQQIQQISLGKLVEHPDNPNKMSAAKFARLVKNIERTGRYEPVIVRPASGVPLSAKKSDTQYASRNTQYEIINGHHRVRALRQLGQKTADCLIWEVDDNEARILLATLNRLGGTDMLDKKIALLRQLNKKMHAKELAKFLPQSAKQLERLTNLKLPKAPAKIKQSGFLRALAFFVNNEQYETIRRALSLADDNQNKQSKAKTNAAALARIAERFIDAHSCPRIM